MMSGVSYVLLRYNPSLNNGQYARLDRLSKTAPTSRGERRYVAP